MDDDRELLRLAAKAAGIELFIEPPSLGCQFDEDRKLFTDLRGSTEWNPLKDDADALRLAVKLRLTIKIEDHECEIFDEVSGECLCSIGMRHPTDPEAQEVTRRAIVLAAAEIGKTK